MARHGADPTHFGADNGDRFPLDHRFQRHLDDFLGLGELCAARAALTVAAKGLAGLAQLFGDFRPLQIVAFQKVLDIRTFLHQRVTLGDQFEFFQPPQRPQAHIEDRLGLNLGE